ncbi:phosphate:AMP phosphotransferase [Methanosarcina sp. 2.H.T.1A.6]|uniref:polyphosphate:AMP phosphotransferase n=1 Tax=unclassified Methanosarcina TaxID=2644672 RepID=UPI0006225F36|nr:MULTISPECIES: polyphosphate:AMP phosphotransferase [unclassified Methanosarcina]KKG16665.1 phosphate:AMP phosphotransferase [Methanosarcina sp. 2.H.T.1A.15]KKG18151.1 phosphate:AMP phosphotransferase [Methanosarcina sp. 2.H.T.1A.3]KKG19374.1 phosphate:AMP phosphotransferase [Methanosarcina sp. 2.H.T.1A.6]KKG25584.1 phosphate:AMP phosphotransferase [Methanosarcina sp. 2.H.T.1A.8]
MLENVDLSQAITNEEYKISMKTLEVKLGELQRRAWELKIPIILVFEGWHASGMGEDINRFILPLDPRGFDFHTMARPCYENRLKPFLLRFWARIPVKGRIGIFDRSWYSRAVIELFGKEKDEIALEKILEEITYFERQLVDDGYLILKFFLHISEKEQKERFKEIKKKDIPLILDEYEGKNGKELDFIEQYDEHLPVVEKILEKTDVPNAPWTIVEANDRNFAVLKIMVTVTHAIEKSIEKITKIPGQQTIKYLDIVTTNLPVLNGSALEKADLSKNLSVEEYRESKKLYQHRLETLQYELFRKKRSVVIIFEGWDAAGKGGDIRRLVEELNPRLYKVVPVGSPNDTEKAHHYLWRFCDAIPMAGHITIFDRSWYGRVLVERIEEFCTEEEWRRAYREINEFEKILADAGAIILKFWLQIDKETQLERFESRLNDPEKRWKITEDDWRNRNRWDDYKVAAEEMLQKTSTTGAPWTIIESRDKRYSRAKVLKTVAETLEDELKKA